MRPSIKPRGTYDEDEDRVTCALCGRALRWVSWAHLVRKHRLDPLHAVKEYKTRFGLTTTRCGALEIKRRASYQAYLEASGKAWTERRVVSEIRRRRRKKEPLYVSWVMRHGGSTLRDAAERRFGSWEKALEAAGADPREIVRKRFWTKPLLIQELQRQARGGALHPADVGRKRYAVYRKAARDLFGSWRAALKPAGLTPLRRERTHWTRAEIRRRIQARITQRRGLGAAEVVATEPALYEAVRVLLRRSWSATVQDLGFKGGPSVRWSKRLLADEIREFHRAGKTHFPGVNQTALYLAARRHFGSWRKALRAAGVRPR